MEVAERYNVKYLEISTLNGSVNCRGTLYYPENEPVMRKLSAEPRFVVPDSSFGITADKPGQR